MNGRIYDPRLGRFLQADPMVQAPKHSQNLNRYSYVLNNPLSYTDPSGYFFEGLSRFVRSFFRLIESGGNWDAWADLFDATVSLIGFSDNQQVVLSPGALTGSFNNQILMPNSAPLDTNPRQISESFTNTTEATIGGTATAITGWKFANGAMTTTFLGMFSNTVINQSQASNVIVTTSTKGTTGEHEYKIRGIICSQSSRSCNLALADRVFEHVNENDVPFTDNDLGDGVRILLPSIPGTKIIRQRIRHSENIPNRSSRNITLPGHVFFPGAVDHNVRFENGELIYEVLGTGKGANPKLNNLVGVFIFRHEVIKTIEKFGEK